MGRFFDHVLLLVASLFLPVSHQTTFHWSNPCMQHHYSNIGKVRPIFKRSTQPAFLVSDRSLQKLKQDLITSTNVLHIIQRKIENASENDVHIQYLRRTAAKAYFDSMVWRDTAEPSTDETLMQLFASWTHVIFFCDQMKQNLAAVSDVTTGEAKELYNLLVIFQQGKQEETFIGGLYNIICFVYSLSTQPGKLSNIHFNLNFIPKSFVGGTLAKVLDDIYIVSMVIDSLIAHIIVSIEKLIPLDSTAEKY